MTVDASNVIVNGEQPPDSTRTDAENLYSVRTLVITTLAFVIGLFAGVAAGLPAAPGAARALGATAGVLMGVINRLASAFVAGLAGLVAAGSLNGLAGRKY